MKILIFSDSHGDTAAMHIAVGAHKPDMLIHLGDVYGDALALKRYGIPLRCVAGNNDYFAKINKSDELELSGKKIFLTHGHAFGVKSESGLRSLLEHGARNGYDAVLFGHTHRPYVRRRSGLWMICPGSIGGWGARATYGVMEVDEAGIEVEINEA